MDLFWRGARTSNGNDWKTEIPSLVMKILSH
jgi:hypothetical protein